jgi:drug/metabolite transporter (DMT)-like permease
LKKHTLAIVALFLVATAWGTTFTLIKSILSRIAPEPFIFWRFTIAGIVLLAFAAAARRLDRASIRPGFILGFLVFTGYWCQTRGLITISPSRSALLTGIYVVMVPFADRVLYRARIAPAAWVGSVLALIGTAMLIGGFDGRPQLGDVLTLICAVCFAMHVVLSAKYTAFCSALGLAAMQVLFVGLLAAPPSLFVARPQATRTVIIVVLFTAIVTTALAFVALMWGQARVTATEAAVMLAFEPVAAALTSVIFYDEPVTVMFVIGALLILAAMVVSQLPEKSFRDPIAP